MPNAEVAARETAVQAHLADAGYPTPKVHLAAGPGTELDQAWMVMDLAPGQPLLAGLSGASALLRLPQIARNLPDTLAQHAATLHGLDPTPLLSKLTDAPAPLERIHAQAMLTGRSDLESVAAWLDRNRPSAGQPAICHGDLHPFNILTAPTGDTVLDWSTAAIADPAYDMAFTRFLLSHPPLPAPRALRPVIGAAGHQLARRLILSYNRLAAKPLDPAQLDWHTNLHLLRILTEVGSWEAQGETDQHLGHPFLTIVSTVSHRLERSTGIPISTQ
jgi:aminoglycoside phosphotransferase (APT) family kinase protein